MITQEELKQLLHYDPDTGHFTWLVTNSNRPKYRRAGSVTKMGHRHIRVIVIGGKKYREHRLAYLYVYGQLPTDKPQIDHINGNQFDNRIKNLRAVNNQENQCNRKLGENNKSGIFGVFYRETHQTWMVYIGSKYLGSYNNIIDAVADRLRAEREHGYHKNHGRINPIQD